MAYVLPETVVSPARRWQMLDVLLDKGEGNPSYAIGTWDGKRTIVYRWNGYGDAPGGNPQSRGYPTWIVLDEGLHDAAIAMAKPEKQAIANAFFGIRQPKPGM